MNKKKNSMVKNASILMVATLISRVIGLIYRRPLGSILGSVGLGYYGYASNLYSILLLISSYSIPMAVSKIISEKLAKKEYKNSKKIFRGALIYAMIAGGVAALIAFFGGGILLPQNQQNAVPALQVLAPTIFLSAILGVLRGYFQAQHDMMPTSVSQILEQLMNAVVSIFAAWILIDSFAPEGGTSAAIYGSVGGTLGTGAGVAVALIFMLFVYKKRKGRMDKRCAADRHKRVYSYRHVLGMILLMLTPIILTTFINNAATYVDSYIYSAIMGVKGVDADSISAAYGEFSNYYTPIMNIPLALASASASAMMPEVSEAYALEDRKIANKRIAMTLKITMFICIPATVGLTVLAYPIMSLLFPAASDLAAKLLMTGALYVVFTALCTITSCALQAIGRQKTAMINAAIALGVNIAVLAILLMFLPRLDIYAVMIVGIVFSIVYSILNAVSMRKYLGFIGEFKKTYEEPVLASAIMGIIAVGVYYGLRYLTKRPSIALIIAIVVAVFAYLILYIFISGTKKEELKKYPLGSVLVKILRALRIYR